MAATKGSRKADGRRKAVKSLGEALSTAARKG
jgi:hypothetical protein